MALSRCPATTEPQTTRPYLIDIHYHKFKMPLTVLMERNGFLYYTNKRIITNQLDCRQLTAFIITWAL